MLIKENKKNGKRDDSYDKEFKIESYREDQNLIQCKLVENIQQSLGCSK